MNAMTKGLPHMDWVTVDYGKGVVHLVSENDALTVRIRATYHKEDKVTELTIATEDGVGGHTSVTGAPDTPSFNTVVNDLKVLAARRLLWEIEHPRDGVPEDLDF